MKRKTPEEQQRADLLGHRLDAIFVLLFNFVYVCISAAKLGPQDEGTQQLLLLRNNNIQQQQLLHSRDAPLHLIRP